MIGGTLVLTGNNSAFNGDVVINPGVNPATPGPDPTATLQAAAQSLPPAIVDHGVLVIDQPTTAVYGGLVTGTGQVTKIGVGALSLTGVNSYSGGTNLNEGVLAIAADSALGTPVGPLTFNGGALRFDGAFNLSAARAITLNGPNGGFAGGGAIDVNGHNATIAQGVAGAGALTVLDSAGGGALVMTGASSYSGGTTISSATLQLGAGGAAGSIIGDVVNNGALVFDRSDVMTFSGAISGSGAVTQLGPGATILTANNTYAGGTTISQGTLQLGAGGTSGAIVGDVLDNGALAFDRSDTVTFPGVVSGSGALLQLGPGVVILNAQNSYGGPTSVTAGALAIGDSAHASAALTGGGAVGVGPFGTLGGYGEILGDVSNSGLIAAANALPAFTGGPTGDLRLAGNVANQGTISLAGSSIGNLVEIGGNYSAGPFGVLSLNTFLNSGGALSNQLTDRLLIAGSASGETTVRVQAVGAGAYTSVDKARAGEGISLIQVAGASSANAFALQGGYVTGGTPFQYHLNAFGPGSPNGPAAPSQNLVGNAGSFWDYRLQSVYVTPDGPIPPRPDPPAPPPDSRLELASQIPSYLAAPNALFNAGFQDLDSLHRRLGDIRDNQAAGTGRDYEIFARGYGGAFNYSSNVGFADYGFNAAQDYAAMQFGANWIARDNEDGTLRIGLAAAFGRLWLQPSAVDGPSQATFDTRSVFGTLTWLSRSGWYVDAVLMAGTFDGSVTTPSRGETASLDGTSFAASLETGYPIALGWGGLTLEPQAQLVYQRLNFAERTDVDGVNVNLGDPNQGVARIGARLIETFSGNNGAVFTGYLKASLLQGLGGGDAVNLGGVTFPTGRFGTALQGVVGLTGALSTTMNLFGEAGLQQNFGDGGLRGWTINAGLRSAF